VIAPRTTFPTEEEVQNLQQAGFSHDQIAGLLTLRALNIQGAYDEDDPERKRQEFIRWLYLQGRLES
jgi:hypothetical protein